MGEYNAFVTFLTVLLFFSILPTGQTVGPIFVLLPQTTCIHARTVLLGVRTIDDVIWGKYAPKTSQKGAWIGNFQLNHKKIFKLRYHQNYLTNLNQILHCDKDQQCHLAGGTAHAYKESKMADGHHIGNEKLAITPKPFNQSWRNFALTYRLWPQTTRKVKVCIF